MSKSNEYDDFEENTKLSSPKYFVNSSDSIAMLKKLGYSKRMDECEVKYVTDCLKGMMDTVGENY
jgi:hypothetical protein